MKQSIYIICLYFLCQSVYGQDLVEEALRINAEITTLQETAVESVNVDCIDEEPPVEERLIYMLHGLAGSENSWSDASTHIESLFRSSTVAPSYKEVSGRPIENMANYVRNNELKSAQQTRLEGFKPENAFIISHSLGGLVGRRIWEQYDEANRPLIDRPYGGLVTFGTPHKGAPIATNLDALNPFIDNACTNLAKGFLAEGLDDRERFLKFIENLISVEGVINFVCGISSDVGLHLLKRHLGETPADLAPNSNFLYNLNRFPEDNLCKVAFYGRETNGRELWSLLFYLINSPNSFDTFRANSDGPLVNQAIRNKDSAFRRADVWYTRAEEGPSRLRSTRLQLANYYMQTGA